MESYTLFVNWKTVFFRWLTSPELIYKFWSTLNQNLNRTFSKVRQVYSKIYMKIKKLEFSKHCKKNLDSNSFPEDSEVLGASLTHSSN